MYFQGKGTATINSMSVPFLLFKNGYNARERVALYPQFVLKWAQRKGISLSVPTVCFKMGTTQEGKSLCTHGSLQNGHSARASATLYPRLAPKWAQRKRISYSVPTAHSKVGTAQEHQLLCTHSSLQSGHSARASATLYPRLAPKWAQRWNYKNLCLTYQTVHKNEMPTVNRNPHSRHFKYIN